MCGWMEGLNISLFIKAAAFVLLGLALQSEPPKVPQAQQPDGAAHASPFAETERLLQLGKYTEAIADLDALSAKNPHMPGLARELGLAYYKQGDYVKAAASFKNALEENPGDNEAVQLMGISYY